MAAVAIDHRAFGRDRRRTRRRWTAVLRAHGADLVCLAGYMRLLTPWLVSRWNGRMLNIHPSLLPALPGLNTHARALAAGACRTWLHGASGHRGMDEGPVVDRQSVPVLAQDTPESLARRVLEQEHVLYPRALRAFIGDVREGRRALPPQPGPP